jgi:hypothetical protein
MRALLYYLFSRSMWAQPAPVVAARQMRALLVYLFSLSARAQAVTVVAGTTVESAALASVRSVGIDSASHCFGWQDR